MKNLRAIYRLCYFLFCAFIVFIYTGGLFLFVRNKIRRYKKTSRILQLLSYKLIKTLGFKVTLEGEEYLKKDNNYLIVTNHTSYTDISLLQAFLKDNRFISHYEIKEKNPYLNLISIASGAYFIERRSLQNIRKELRGAIDILQKGLHLVFFPEGTSTDGSKIFPFHAPFFFTAISAKKSVLPVYIQYKKIGEEKISIQNRDKIHWYGEMGFIDHFLSFLKIKSVEVNIRFLPPVSSEGKTARRLAEETRRKLQENFVPFSDLN